MPGVRVDGVNVTVITAEIDPFVVDHRGRNDSIASRKLPFDSVELSRTAPGKRTGMRRVSAEHGLCLASTGQAQTNENKKTGESANVFRRWT